MSDKKNDAGHGDQAPKEGDQLTKKFTTSLAQQPVPTLKVLVTQYLRQSNLTKVLVLGDAATGKTSLIKRYVHNVFAPHHKATVGTDFHMKQLLIDDLAVRLQLWDVAGQERFGNVATVYYKDAAGVFLLYDLTRPSTFEHVVEWKKELDQKTETMATNIPVVLIGNKSDLHEAELDKAFLDNFCEQHGFIGWFATSAKKNENIDKAAQFLVGKILQRPELLVKKGAQQKSTVQLGAAPANTDHLNSNNGKTAAKSSGCC